MKTQTNVRFSMAGSGVNKRQSTGGIMDFHKWHSLTIVKKKLLIFVGVTIATFLFVLITVSANFDAVSANPGIIILSALLFETTSLIIFYLMWQMLNALSGVIGYAKKINNGDLSASLPTKSSDEIGQLAYQINDLSVNLQEVLLFTGAIAGDVEKRASEIVRLAGQSKNDEAKHIEKNADEIMQKLDELRGMVSHFEYYNVVFDGKTSKGNEPRQVIEKLKTS